MKKISIKGPIMSNSSATVYKYFGFDAACPNDLRKGLEEANGEDVTIEINSPGGVCVYGYEMYTAIMEYPGKVTVHVISAMSAATLLVCAANEALISDTGIFMIHNAKSSADGDYRDLQMEADALKEFNAGIINAYVRKTGKSREEIQALMDKDTYMSPQSAIEQGFVDGYMFGDPNEKKDATSFVAVASGINIIPEEKATALMKAIKQIEDQEPPVAPVQLNSQDNGSNVNSDKSKEGGKNKMKLNELLEANPEAKAEFDSAIASANAEGVKTERERLHSLDKIAGTVSAEMMNEAKYGEKPIDGPTLAFQAMVNGDQIATAYLQSAKDDATASGVDEVGTGSPDTGDEPADEADQLAGYVNKKKGGK